MLQPDPRTTFVNTKKEFQIMSAVERIQYTEHSMLSI